MARPGPAKAGGALSLSEFTARFTVSLSVESNGRELSAGSQSVVFHGPTPCSLLRLSSRPARRFAPPLPATHKRAQTSTGSIFTWPISYIILHVANPKGCATLHGRLIHAAATNLAGAATMQHLVERPVYLFLSLLRKEAIEDPHLVRAILHSWLQRTSEDSRAARSLRLLARPFAHGFSDAAKIA